MATKKFDFHYTPTGTGVISGPEVLQQTEDAINDIGSYADNASDNSEEALNIAKEASETAQMANSTSSNALAEAEAANEKVLTLKQVVDDWDADIQTAISKSQSAVEASSQAVTNSTEAKSIANQAKDSATQSAQQAQSSANSATEAVQTAQTAQQNAEDALNSAQTAQNQAETAQTSAQNAEKKALEAAESAYAVRTINEPLDISQTITLADLDPQGNIKVGDTVVGTNGRMFLIASIDTEAGTGTLSATWNELTPNVSYAGTQQLTDTQQETARNNIGFITGITGWADTNFNQRVDDYLVPILKELILENGGTQEEIDNIINGTATESETETGT